MKIGVIGSGIVGKTLAAGFEGEGHEVRVGTRDATKLSAWAEEHPKIRVEAPADVASFAEIVVLAVQGSSAVEAVRSLGEQNLEGKVVIDATNPIAETEPVNGALTLFTPSDDSLLERLQQAAPAARFVKAFSCVGAALMVHPKLPGGPPTMFICGDDADAKQIVTGLLTDFGWESEDLGPATSARGIEPLCILWCIPGFLKNDWVHAFKMLRP